MEHRKLTPKLHANEYLGTKSREPDPLIKSIVIMIPSSPSTQKETKPHAKHDQANEAGHPEHVGHPTNQYVLSPSRSPTNSSPVPEPPPPPSVTLIIHQKTLLLLLFFLLALIAKHILRSLLRRRHNSTTARPRTNNRLNRLIIITI
jgi:hypothetical protein